jgi:hypothetical protein
MQPYKNRHKNVENPYERLTPSNAYHGMNHSTSHACCNAILITQHIQYIDTRVLYFITSIPRDLG